MAVRRLLGLLVAAALLGAGHGDDPGGFNLEDALGPIRPTPKGPKKPAGGTGGRGKTTSDGGGQGPGCPDPSTGLAGGCSCPALATCPCSHAEQYHVPRAACTEPQHHGSPIRSLYISYQQKKFCFSIQQGLNAEYVKGENMEAVVSEEPQVKYSVLETQSAEPPKHDGAKV